MNQERIWYQRIRKQSTPTVIPIILSKLLGMIPQSTTGGPLRVRRQDLRVPDHPESEEVAQGAS